jgi:hypothetical protein
MASVGLIQCGLPDDGDRQMFTAKDLVQGKPRQAAVMVAVVVLLPYGASRQRQEFTSPGYVPLDTF